MKKFFLSLAISTAILVPASAALAADLDVDPPPPPTEELRQATYDWTGAYVGAWAGATCVEGALTETPALPTLPIEWENSGCGWKGGVMAGYNHQFDDFVLGVEADWGRSGSIAENETVISPAATADFAFTMEHIVTGRVRAGYAWDDTLFYTTGGVAWAKGDISSISGSGPKGLNGSHWGWSFGGGVEHAFTDQFRLRLEYLFTKFKGDDYSDACCDVEVEDFDDHEIKIGAIWAF